MNSVFSLVPMKKAHFDEIMAIENAVFAVPWSLNAFSELYDNPNAYFICAVRGITRLRDGIIVNRDEVLGYAGMYFTLGSVSEDGETVWLGGADIMNVAVRPDMRRLGIAASLMNALEEEAKRLLLGELLLEVRESNFPARNLYSKLGFIINGRRKNYYKKPREDAILMQKKLQISIESIQ